MVRVVEFRWAIQVHFRWCLVELEVSHSHRRFEMFDDSDRIDDAGSNARMSVEHFSRRAKELQWSSSGSVWCCFESGRKMKEGAQISGSENHSSQHFVHETVLWMSEKKELGSKHPSSPGADADQESPCRGRVDKRCSSQGIFYINPAPGGAFGVTLGTHIWFRISSVFLHRSHYGPRKS